MANKMHGNLVILIMAIYFGWLLAFPFYGPVLQSLAEHYQVAHYPLALIFIFSHAITLLLGGIFFKNLSNWNKMILAGTAASIIINFILFFATPIVWVFGMAALGVSSALCILRWSCAYSLVIPIVGRIKKMAIQMILSNIILLIFNYLSTALTPSFLLAATSIPLFVTLAVFLHIPLALPLENKLFPERISFPLPLPLIILFCLFVAGLYLNGGFMYTIIIPSLDKGLPLFHAYQFIPYIMALLLMYKYGEQLQHYFSVYIGVTLLGIAFVSFALLDKFVTGLIITGILIEAAFAFLDIFIWTSLGILAYIYRAPFRFFGLVLGVMVLSIIAGDLIGSKLFLIGATFHLVTTIFAAATIFLTLLVISWLNDRTNKDFTRMLSSSKEENQNCVTVHTPLNALLTHLPADKNLTPREMEIVSLILTGLKNKDIAKELFISENTLKTHLKNIYGKFNISQKRELLSTALDLVDLTRPDR